MEKKILSKKKKNDTEKCDMKILRSKKVIEEAKEKIKIEKKNIRERKKEEFKKTKFYKFVKRVFSFVKFDRDTYSFSDVVVVTILSLIVGAFSCMSVFVVLSGGKNYFKLSRELSKFVDVYDTLIDNYNGEIDKDKLVDEAIDGMMSSVGDNYTGYVDEENTDKFNEQVVGVYEGIGCTIQLNKNGIEVIEIFDDSPSKKAGLHVGDIILKVDDKDATKMNADDIAKYIKNKNSAEINMIVSRDSKEVKISLIRAEVQTPVVSSTIYEQNNKKIGYLNISIFSSNSSTQFKAKLKELEKDGIDSLVIDVRNNNGGYLSAVTDIASELLAKGDIIYRVEKDKKKTIMKDKNSTEREYPIAILVNQASASASEILAAAIKESYGGYVVGVTTFGKGTVQQTKQLSDGSMIKYTIENWLTPKGNWIDGIGIEPTYEIELSQEYYKKATVENDNQLQKALELVSK